MPDRGSDSQVMSEIDISRLKINRSQAAPAGTSRPRWRGKVLLVLVAIAIAAAWAARVMTAPVPVEPATVSTAYPSQSYTLLSATGYVVAQRKAAAASKATGRLEWLGVREGSHVRQGEVIARLENRDV